MSFGEGSGTEFETMRGRDFPAIRQFTVFMENRVGQLLEVVRRFEGTGIRVVALSINDSAECAFVRLVLSDCERGRELLERAGLAIIETDLIGRYVERFVNHPSGTSGGSLSREFLAKNGFV